MVIELLNLLLRYRVDAIALAVVVLGASLLLPARLSPTEARVSRGSCASVGAILMAGILLAEWTMLVLGPPPSVSPAGLSLARLAILGAAGLVSLVVLTSSIRLARLRADLSAQAAMHQQLHEAKAAADEASRAKSDFIAVMSHEIRTPLNAVIGFANLLSDTRLDAAQRDFVSTITSEGRRLSALINDILDLAKIEEGRLTLERVPFAPVETAHEVLRLFGARAAENNIDLRLETQVTGPLLIAGDPLRFRQVLLNLVDNALKFTPRGSVTLFLTWTPLHEAGGDGRLAVRVRDTGIGIAPEQRRGLFTMFVQAEVCTARRFGGTGLGLAICQRLVGMMGGEITVTSTRGDGAEFAFTLGVTALPSTDGACPTEPDPALPPGWTPRILVVDDMEANRFLLQVFLRHNGFEPTLAAGGEEAVRLATAHGFDAILMDLQMPDLDGYVATQRIRAAEPPGRHTPILALTASVTKGTREKCLAAGMDEYLTKPLDLRRFRSLLRVHLASARPPAETTADLVAS
jgi:two-component system, sensor histidine kinase